MKGSNLFYGILLLFMAYFLDITSFNASLFGINVPIPNPFYYLGQMTLPTPLLNHIPLLIYVGVLGLICIISAFSDQEQKIIYKEVPSSH